nr:MULTISPECIES: IGHMBP2 family helicase [unclassified Halanaerobium]
MINLEIFDIDKSIGPGDIVGAFINEVGLNSNDIGKIKIDKKNKKAEVEVAEESAKKVVEIMDDNQIGGVHVRVKAKSPDDLNDKKVIEYYKKFRSLVELERQEEMERHKLEIKYLSPKERQAKGRAILDLKGKDDGTAFGHKPAVKFIKQNKGTKLPDTEIGPGDLVMISLNNPLNSDNPTGTVSEKTRFSLTVAFDRQPPSFVYGKNLRLDLYVNDISFQRMFTALEQVKNCPKKMKKKRDLLLNKVKPAYSEKEIEVLNNNLDEYQKKAVEKSLKAEDIFLIQGPPGTGKTITAVEIIKNNIEVNNSVLAAADSNIAVDNLVELLAAEDIDVLRIGHPIRITKSLREHTLDYMVLEHPDYKKAEKLRDEVSELINEQEDYIHPSGKYRRGLSDQEIREYAEKGIDHHVRGIKPKIINEMAVWLELQSKINNYFSRIKELEQSAVNELIEKADVVCTTNITAGSELLEDKFFDLSVIDEATQSTEPSALIPYLKSRKTILIGDHKQLPPTVLSKEVLKQGLDRSLFERFMELYGEEFSYQLKIQYRMHKKIMEFSSREFYNSNLEAAEEVAEHTLKDIGVAVDSDGSDCFADKVLFEDYPVVFLDTSEMEAAERSLSGSNSYDNPVEAEIVLDIADKAVKWGVDEKDLAVITPYKDQVDLLYQHCKFENIEINTVDGFQGREKEMIIFSSVRSNSKGNIGFLRDLRRLNVALTRARRKLVFIGDINTISKHKTYKSLVDYIRENGLFYKL